MISLKDQDLIIEKFPKFGRRPESRKRRDHVTLELHTGSDMSITIFVRNGSTTSEMFVSKSVKFMKETNPQDKTTVVGLIIPEVRVSVLIQNVNESTAAFLGSLISGNSENMEPINIAASEPTLVAVKSEETTPADCVPNINDNKVLEGASEEIVQMPSKVHVTPTKSPHKKKIKKSQSPPFASVRLQFESDAESTLSAAPSAQASMVPANRGIERFLSFKSEVRSSPAQPRIEAKGRPESTTTAKLTSEQQKIVQACKSGSSVLVTGGAGTGKSFLIDLIAREMVKQHGKQAVFITATTGLAAVAVGGSTIHQFAGLPAFDNDTIESPESFAKQISLRDNGSSSRRWKQARVLIIDEVSMLSALALEVLDAMAKLSRESSEPMGGLQLILCGDFFQLPPIIKQNGLTTSGVAGGIISSKLSQASGGFGYSSAVQSSGLTQWLQNSQEFSLSQDFVSTGNREHARQESDAVFSQILESIRLGTVSQEDQIILNQSYQRELLSDDGILPTRIYTHRKDVDTLNISELAKLSGPEHEYVALDSGDRPFLQTLQASCPAKQKIKLKIGAQVILLKNLNTADGLVNGSRGVLIRFTRDTKRPVVRFSGGLERIIGTESFVLSMGNRVVAQRIQIPLDLAWSLSVHKAQGLTVEKAVVNLRKVFESGQAYVALSRVRCMQGLSLETPFDLKSIKTDPCVREFYAKLEEDDLYASDSK